MVDLADPRSLRSTVPCILYTVRCTVLYFALLYSLSLYLSPSPSLHPTPDLRSYLYVSPDAAGHPLPPIVAFAPTHPHQGRPP